MSRLINGDNSIIIHSIVIEGQKKTYLISHPETIKYFTNLVCGMKKTKPKWDFADGRHNSGYYVYINFGLGRSAIGRIVSQTNSLLIFFAYPYINEDPPEFYKILLPEPIPNEIIDILHKMWDLDR